MTTETDLDLEKQQITKIRFGWYHLLIGIAALCLAPFILVRNVEEARILWGMALTLMLLANFGNSWFSFNDARKLKARIDDKVQPVEV